MAECLWVVAPEGPAVASVMSLPGSARCFFASFPTTIRSVALETFDCFREVGDQRMIEAAGAHPCRLFCWRDLEDMTHRLGRT